MAAGDTIDGQIRIVLEDTQGNRNIVLGSLPQNKLDLVNQTLDPNERTYVNTSLTMRTSAPAGAQTRTAENAVFEPGESLIVQHKSTTASARSHDVDFDAYGIEGVTVDLNRGNDFSETLTASDQEIASNVSESDTEFVDIFKFTVPDRQRFLLAGQLEAVGIEA